MLKKLHTSLMLNPLIQLAVVVIFVAPSLMFYKKMAPQTMWMGLVTFILVAAFALFASKFSFNRKLGADLTKLGASFWGLGWAMMTLFNLQVGWWIFMGGWVSLSLGLSIVGTADFHKYRANIFSFLLLLAGFWPLVAEFSTGAFNQYLDPFYQLQIMFLFTAGWILQGSALSNSKAPELVPIKQQSFSSTNA